jgi:hypothetical protein
LRTGLRPHWQRGTIVSHTRSDLPKLAATDRAQATPDEAKAVFGGTIAYFGLYSVNEADRVITTHIEGSTVANMIETHQTRVITSLTADELKFTNPAPLSGATLQTVWKRVK